jgi:LacI family repressor for deo operon, udp, cdd, tsx, nupC, and nupG
VTATSRGRPTIRDVATLAGVASSTVSRSLSHPSRVHPATRARVLQAAREIDYRSRRGGEPLSSAIALLVPDIANPYYAGLARGAQLQLAAAGLSQLLADTQESPALEAQALAQVGGLAAGVVLAATRLSDEQLRAAAREMPLVVINRVADGLSSVCLDTSAGVRQAVDHLVSLGHSSIAYLSGPPESWSNGRRWSALERAATERRITAIQLGPFVPALAGGAAAADSALNSGASACVAFNDLLAIGAMRRLAERGVRVPGQMSMVGCDDIFGTDFCDPPLTTIAGDLQRVGRTAVGLLLALLADPGREPETVTLPTHLTIRRSTGTAGAR